MIKKAKTVGIIVFMLLVSVNSMAGQIYKWVDEDGRTHFSSSPPVQGDAETVQPKATNTYTSPKLPDASDSGSKHITNKKKVVMYSAVWCGVCKKAKNYFRVHRIPFKEYDIETSAKGRSDYKKLHGSGVPIILVDDQRMNGFDAGRFESMYGG